MRSWKKSTKSTKKVAFVRGLQCESMATTPQILASMVNY